MSDYAITHTFVFTDEVLRELPDAGDVSSRAPPIITPFLVPGDFVKIGEVKGRTFVVVTRLIDYVSAQELEVTYLLDFAPFEKKEQPILRLVNRAQKPGV